MNFTREGKYHHQLHRAQSQGASVTAVGFYIALLLKFLSEKAVVNSEVDLSPEPQILCVSSLSLSSSR